MVDFSGVYRRREIARTGLAGAALTLAGCSDAPSQNILGSYFPSWMICAIAGLLLSVVAHRLFAVAGLDKSIPLPVLVFLALSAFFAFAVWLVWLG